MLHATVAEFSMST